MPLAHLRLRVPMPELPEVQTIVADLLAAGLRGATVTNVAVHWPRTVADLGCREFADRLSGRRISAIRRRAKFIIFDFAPDLHLLVHLRMSGRTRTSSGSPFEQTFGFARAVREGNRILVAGTGPQLAGCGVQATVALALSGEFLQVLEKRSELERDLPLRFCLLVFG